MIGDHFDSLENGLLRPELFIGVVSCVSAQAVRFNVNAAGSPSGTHFHGDRYGKGEVGEFVLVEGQVCHLLGRIGEVRLPERDRRSVNPSASQAEELDAVGSIQLLGSVSMDTLRVTAGILAYPRLGDRIYSAPHQLLARLPQLMEPDDAPVAEVLLTLGMIDVAKESAVRLKPEKLFGRHCAILGATGGGKSWTTARIIEECLKHKAKLILLDATGEYRGFYGAHVEHYHLGDPPGQRKHTDSKKASLPPSTFLESDFIAMFEPAGKVQGPRLQSAIKSLRLATLDLQVAIDGLIPKASKSKKPIEDAERKHSHAVNDPSTPFNIHKLVRQLEEECVFPSANFGKDPTKWGDRSDSDISYCLSLLTRITAVISSPAFACVFKDTENPLNQLFNNFVKSDKRLLRLCLSGISHEFKAREIVVNVIGRKLLSLARHGTFLQAPLVVIVDEAHNFLGRHIGGEDTVAKLDAFELIAKEGRKYGLNICLTTQRPRDITEGVLSQMGTLIVHRLTNDRDREVVERACGEIDRSAASFLPTLKPGEAAIIGADFPIPLTIQVLQPETKPKSDGPRFQDHWRQHDRKDELTCSVLSDLELSSEVMGISTNTDVPPPAPSIPLTRPTIDTPNDLPFPNEQEFKDDDIPF